MAKFNYKKWVTENKYGKLPTDEGQKKDHDGDGDIDSDDYLQAKDKAIKKAMGKDNLDENVFDLRNQLTEDPSMWSAIGGIMGLLGSASIVASLEMMSEDPAIQEKYPKATDALRKIFGFLGKVGGDMASGMGKGVGFKEGKENKGMGYKEYLKKEIEGDKEEKEDVEETK